MAGPRALTVLLSALAGAWLGGCESIANLDDVRITDPPPGDAGSDAADASADAHDAQTEDVGEPDAPDASDAPYSFPPSCVKPGSVAMQCNPMTNEGCGADTACDMASGTSGYGFVCFPTGTVDEGEPCNGVSGPWCKPTLHCGTTTCTKFCCTHADCGGSTPSCGMYDPFKVGTFGWCQ